MRRAALSLAALSMAALLTLVAAAPPNPPVPPVPPVPPPAEVPLLPRPTTTPLVPAPAPAAPPRVVGQPLPDAGLHIDYDRLLRAYVREDGVRYAAWQATKADRLALIDYIHRLERLDPAAWPEKAAETYWINLYNAATLHLILKNYPLKSIKDLKAPWDTPVVTVAGRPLTLNDIENKILRPTYQDPRIHFALNCAAVGCPPLRIGAFSSDSLDQQMNVNCRRAMNDPRFLRIDGYTVHHSKLFEWYAGDFRPDAMAIREFMSRYVPDNVARKLTEPTYRLVAMEYDWKLNRSAEQGHHSGAPGRQ